MRAARLANSPRLQRIDRFLSDGREYTTLEILQGANVANVSASVSELRDPINGRVIRCTRRGDLWFYRRDFAAERVRAKRRAAA